MQRLLRWVFFRVVLLGRNHKPNLYLKIKTNQRIVRGRLDNPSKSFQHPSIQSKTKVYFCPVCGRRVLNQTITDKKHTHTIERALFCCCQVRLKRTMSQESVKKVGHRADDMARNVGEKYKKWREQQSARLYSTEPSGLLTHWLGRDCTVQSWWAGLHQRSAHTLHTQTHTQSKRKERVCPFLSLYQQTISLF